MTNECSYWGAVAKIGDSLAQALAKTDRGQAFARLELAARLKEITQILKSRMQPKYKINQIVETPYGEGKVIDAYMHARDPESDPDTWMYSVEITSREHNGLNPAVFQESEIKNTKTK